MSSPPVPVLRLPVRLSQRHKRWLYATGAVLCCSGLGWLVAHDLLGGQGPFGDAPHPSEPWWLRIHGAAAMGFLVALGSLLPGHVARAWQMRRNHRSGLFMLVLAALLVATGYGLYYAGDEQTRPWISCVHWLLGVAAAGVAPLHVYLGRRSAMAERGPGPGRPATDVSEAAAGAGVAGQAPRPAGRDAVRRA
ncbi:hypothetical protein [Ralstonia pseudosolanacearum]|uniref:Putative transmembrane protein n=1 Tax=Ralstonia solanacearum TaxID=305 RepID=A0A0S4WTK9_RALSL|nr:MULTISPECIES: hypothetical protein [Ralstonia]UZF14309.1 hypothetical protein LH706_15005 [Ralstonia solanacearum]MDO3522046.1 hypothetical protein [Ralstonia pseudosolanacearum]MDO3548875.1 hypothetical protein [Ralstonia pseudosolanacearum]MDO3553920.1 hypothetical protein [Ralstonia pseudosolanacearum]MDO3569361.1 hypothetical protein [Ralstonia pseudosolanacearum]